MEKIKVIIKYDLFKAIGLTVEKCSAYTEDSDSYVRINPSKSFALTAALLCLRSRSVMDAPILGSEITVSYRIVFAWKRFCIIDSSVFSPFMYASKRYV